MSNLKKFCGKHIGCAFLALSPFALVGTLLLGTMIKTTEHTFVNTAIQQDGLDIRSRIVGDSQLQGRTRIVGAPYDLLLWVEPEPNGQAILSCELVSYEITTNGEADQTNKKTPEVSVKKTDAHFFIWVKDIDDVPLGDFVLVLTLQVQWADGTKQTVTIRTDCIYEYKSYRSNRLWDGMMSA